jgi:hypothetical protein
MAIHMVGLIPIANQLGNSSYSSPYPSNAAVGTGYLPVSPVPMSVFTLRSGEFTRILP